MELKIYSIEHFQEWKKKKTNFEIVSIFLSHTQMANGTDKM